ncbi:MAG: Hpt domain-containing protein [Clostridia bacterium]|nr:Hpt domain-containing protein [Clostridia bacterium]
MLTVEKLRAFGANVEEGLGRCINNEQFYLRLVERAIADPGFEKLMEAAEKGDLEQGFALSHALKGVTANLALTPLYVPLCEITELFRNKTQTDYVPLVAAILEKRDELTKRN